MEKGKFYLDQVKKNNVKFIKLFKRSKADNFMYNGEYTKMKKFYRGNEMRKNIGRIGRRNLKIPL